MSVANNLDDDRFDDAFARAEKRLEEGGGEAWKPAKDKEHPRRIVGQVLRVEFRTVNTARMGAVTTPVVTLRQTDGFTWDVWAFGTVLRNQLKRENTQPGDVIAIEYRGQREVVGGGNSYHDYKVARADDAEAEGFDWGSVPGGDEGGPIDDGPPIVVYGQPADGPPSTEPEKSSAQLGPDDDLPY